MFMVNRYRNRDLSLLLTFKVLQIGEQMRQLRCIECLGELCIIIGPQGQNVDVIAHEWLHAEIQHRVGFFRFLKEIPVWFDEGAALTLDYREPFLPENIDLPVEDVTAVKKLKSGKSFFE
ncbi:MAG: hypothetical protein U5M23_06135 [Marinagarivorans sp.]|nr:hypothetical protein [Marinagarivorans sp.]